MHPEIDRFAHLGSPIHRWDPRWKLGTLLLLMLSFGIGEAGFGTGADDALYRLAVHAAPLGVSLAILAVSRIPPGTVLRRLRAVSCFLAVLVVVVSLTHGGERFQWWMLSPSREGLVRSGILVLRVLSIVLLVFPAFGTSRFDVTIKALGRLRVPAPLIQIVLFSYRYLFVYSDQMRRMGLAQRARGFRARRDLKTLQLMGNRIGVLLVGSVERTQRIQGAMKCRGFSGTYRTLERFTTRPGDVVAAVGLLAIGAVLLAWRVS